MTHLINPRDIHSAADTWSGFIYQGKVALYHVLSVIVQKQDVTGLFLQLDSLEDFAIIKYDEIGLTIPVSLHQVKAMKSNSYATYKKDFEKLERKANTFPCEGGAFFHLAMKNEKTKADIEALHPQINIYEYENESFCKIEKLQEKINSKIKLCLPILNLEEFVNKDEYIDTLSNSLEELISDRILFIHANNHEEGGLRINEGAYHFTISLDDFVTILKSDINSLLFDESYYLKILKRDLNHYYQEYCVENEETIPIEEREKLSNYLILFNSLIYSEFTSFLQNIMPHKEVKFSKLQEYKDNSLQKDEFKNAFIRILHEIRKSEDNVNKGLGWICNEGKRYFPSTINVPNDEYNKKEICKKIITTSLSNSVEIPFNADYIITGASNIESIGATAGNIFNNWEEKDYDKITNWKKLSLIGIEDAKNKLNENNN